MLLADADGFFKSPNVYDVVGVAGFVIGIGSIWVSWWLAKRAITKRLADAEARASAAARDEVRRVARAVLQTGVSATVRLLELAREACTGKQWPRAADLCIFARDQLARVLAQYAADHTIQTDLQNVSANLQVCVVRLRAKAKRGAGEVPEGVSSALDGSILALHGVESRMTSIRVE